MPRKPYRYSELAYRKQMNAVAGLKRVVVRLRRHLSEVHGCDYDGYGWLRPPP